MKRYFSVMLLSVFYSFPLQADVRGEVSLLKMQQETVVLLNQINLAHIAGLRECTCYLLKKSNGTLDKSCAKIDGSEEPKFIRTIINIYGQSVSSQLSCQTVVDAFVFNRLESQWSALTLNMSLMGDQWASLPEAVDNDFLSVDGIDSNFADLRNGVNKKLNHLIQELPWQKSLPKVASIDLTREQYESASKIYLHEAGLACHQYVNEYLVNYSNNRSLMIGMLPSIGEFNDSEMVCDLILSADFKAKPELQKEMAKRFQPVMARLRAWKARFQKKHRDNYAKAIQSNPLLVVFRNPNPSLDEVLGALLPIEENARDRLRDSMENLENHRNELSSLNFAHAIPYTRARWLAEGFSNDLFLQDLESSTEELAKKETQELYLTGATTVGIMVACVLPWGRAAFPVLKLLKASCLVGLGVPLNAFFLYDSLKMYEKGLQDFFSSVEFNQAIKGSFSRYESGQMASILSALLLPVGMNLAEVQTARSLMAKMLLSKRTH